MQTAVLDQEERNRNVSPQVFSADAPSVNFLSLSLLLARERILANESIDRRRRYWSLFFLLVDLARLAEWIPSLRLMFLPLI